MASSSKTSDKPWKKVDPKFAVHLFWDFENTPVVPPHLMETLIENIEASLQTMNPRYHLATVKYAAGNVNLDFIANYEDILEKEIFEVDAAPKRARICEDCKSLYEKSKNVNKPYERLYDVADRIILQQMLQLVTTKHVAKNILLVSSDSDFGITLKMFKKNGYKVMLGRLPKDSRFGYERNAHYVWDWSKMQKERAWCKCF